MSVDRYRRDRRDDFERNAAGPFSTRTNSKDPVLVNSRVFIGNLATDKVDRKALLNMFEKYGTVLGVSVLSGYGFVQFEHEDDAREAVENEQGGLLKGSKIDVKMAAEGKKQQQEQNQKRALSSARGGRGASTFRHERDQGRSRSPVYDRRPLDSRRPPHDRRLPPHDDRRPPLLDDRRPPLSDPARRLPPPPRDLYSRKDPYDRERERERYTRVPSPYYIPEPLPLPPPADNIFRPPYECEIILTSSTLRTYADSIESQLKPHGMVVQHNVVKSEADIPKAVEDLTHLKVPYAISLSQKNELHHSMTLNILHGTPQEHRNMPLEDALKLIVRTFEAYVQEIRNKAAAPLPAAASPVRSDFLPPDEHTAYLLNLLADNRILNLDEITHIIGYLEKRRKVLIDIKRPPAVLAATSMAPERADLGLQQEVSAALYNSPAVSVANTASINFNNPSVQKALDDLIQTSGPSGLLPNIAAFQASSDMGDMPRF